ncbi:MAG TPA: PRC-barrel domain-containing protein [Xanthobacteraceae bacterium]|nr:PRC-barrel domain-containing protein [Xanthobacteraceae bacterium]
MMPDDRKPSRTKALLLMLPLMGLAAPLHAQTPSPPVANAAAAAKTATNPVRVADLIDRPILDENRSVMGRIRAVVRAGDGKIQLLLPLGGLFGFGERLVGVPIESVTLTGAQVMVVEMPPDRFQKSATWYGSDSETLAGAETISISRR